MNWRFNVVREITGACVEKKNEKGGTLEEK